MVYLIHLYLLSLSEYLLNIRRTIIIAQVHYTQVTQYCVRATINDYDYLLTTICLLHSIFMKDYLG